MRLHLIITTSQRIIETADKQIPGEILHRMTTTSRTEENQETMMTDMMTAPPHTGIYNHPVNKTQRANAG